VVVAALVRAMASPGSGPINIVLQAFGAKPIYFMADPKWFRLMVILSGIWKNAGWGTVIYLAALSNVDPALHEAALVDGATRLQRIWHINLPTILPIVVIVLILGMGGMLRGNFDQMYNLQSEIVRQVADIVDTYVYRAGLMSARIQFSYGAAVGLFQSVIGFVLVLSVNAIARRVTGGERRGTLW
jgi:putative aldouronate transport system permease protein